METLHIDNMTERGNIGSKPNEPIKQFSASGITDNHIFNPEGENLGKVKIWSLIFAKVKLNI